MRGAWVNCIILLKKRSGGVTTENATFMKTVIIVVVIELDGNNENEIEFLSRIIGVKLFSEEFNSLKE